MSFRAEHKASRKGMATKMSLPATNPHKSASSAAELAAIEQHPLFMSGLPKNFESNKLLAGLAPLAAGYIAADAPDAKKSPPQQQADGDYDDDDEDNNMIQKPKQQPKLMRLGTYLANQRASERRRARDKNSNASPFWTSQKVMYRSGTPTTRPRRRATSAEREMEKADILSTKAASQASRNATNPPQSGNAMSCSSLSTTTVEQDGDNDNDDDNDNDNQHAAEDGGSNEKSSNKTDGGDGDDEDGESPPPSSDVLEMALFMRMWKA